MIHVWSRESRKFSGVNTVCNRHRNASLLTHQSSCVFTADIWQRNIARPQLSVLRMRTAIHSRRDLYDSLTAYNENCSNRHETSQPVALAYGKTGARRRHFCMSCGLRSDSYVILDINLTNMIMTMFMFTSRPRTGGGGTARCQNDFLSNLLTLNSAIGS